MMSGFNRLKLSQRLTIFLVFPIVPTIAVVAYFIHQKVIFTSSLLLWGSVLLCMCVAYVMFVIFFARKLARGVELIRYITTSLASGNFNGALISNGMMTEITETVKALRDLQHDIEQQAKFTEEIRSGNLNTVYKPRHERDVLGQSLLSIKENLIRVKQEDEQRHWASTGLAKFVEILQSTSDLKTLCNNLIINLVRTIHATQGAIFILMEDDTGTAFLEMQACYAYNRTKHLTKRIEIGEGVIGQAFLEKDTVYLKEVPDHFVRITSGLGEANPRNILIVPLKMNDEVVGVAELASFSEFGKHVIEFVEKIGENIAHNVSSFKVAANTRKLLEESQAQTEQMRAQEEELRQNQEELQATQEEISRKYNALFKQLTELNYQSRFDQLKSITSTKKRNIEYYFDIIRNQILTFSEDKMIVEAVKAFRHAYYALQHIGEDRIPLMQSVLRQYYADEFITRLNDTIDQTTNADQYIPTEKTATMLQYLYIAANPHPTGKKSLLDDAGDGSEYSQIHKRYHPTIRNFLEKFGYYDIFLIDAHTGDMLYSVFKEVDFATSLTTGRYHNTNFGRVVKQAMKSNDPDFVQLIDFEPYAPSYYAPASFIASPVYDGTEKIGILIFQMPINKINQILTGNNKWREDGLGESGETFIVGSDYKFRSIARALLEDMETYVTSLKKRGYEESTIRQIQKMETNILQETIKLDSVTSALQGQTGTKLERDSKFEDMLIAFAPLNIPDVQWVIMSTMKEVEASMRINNLMNSKI